MKPYRRRYRKAQVRIDQMRFHPPFQRETKPHIVKHIREHLDLDALGVFFLWGKDLWILDGQHRATVMLEDGLGEWEADCHIFDDLTEAEAAELFRLKQYANKQSAFDDFKAGRISGDPEWTAIERIAGRVGLSVSSSVGPGRIACPAECRRAYRLSPAALGLALNTLVAAWGAVPEAVEKELVGGLAEFHHRNNGLVDQDRLTKKLAKLPGGPRRLIGLGKGNKDLRGGSVAKNVARAVLDIYNKGSRGDGLPLF